MEAESTAPDTLNQKKSESRINQLEPPQKDQLKLNLSSFDSPEASPTPNSPPRDRQRTAHFGKPIEDDVLDSCRRNLHLEESELQERQKIEEEEDLGDIELHPFPLELLTEEQLAEEEKEDNQKDQKQTGVETKEPEKNEEELNYRVWVREDKEERRGWPQKERPKQEDSGWSFPCNVGYEYYQEEGVEQGDQISLILEGVQQESPELGEEGMMEQQELLERALLSRIRLRTIEIMDEEIVSRYVEMMRETFERREDHKEEEEMLEEIGSIAERVIG